MPMHCFVLATQGFMNAATSSFFNSPTCDLRDAMPRQMSLTHTHSPYPLPSKSPFKSSLTLPWTIARFLNPFYTFNPAHRRVIRDRMIPVPYLGKRRIFPGVRTILDICLRTHI